MKNISAALAAHIAQESMTISMCVKLILTTYQPPIVSISNANPGIVETLWAPDYVSGDAARIIGVRGMTELNGVDVTLTEVDPTHFSIGVDTSAYGEYASKGELRKVLGFTEFIHDLTFESILYRTAIGYMPRSIKGGSDLSVDNLEIVGLMPNKVKALAQGLLLQGLSDEDLDVGRFDHARAELFYVNYNDLTMGRLILPGSGNIGQIKLRRGTHESELRGKTIYLQQSFGDLYSKLCRARLGDDIGDGTGTHDYKKQGFGCKVRLDPPTWRGSVAAAVVAVDTGAKKFSIAGDLAAALAGSAFIAIDGSTGNDGQYTVASITYNSGTSQTDIVVEETVPDATVDGDLLYGRYYTVRPPYDAALGSVVKPTTANGRHYKCSQAGVPGTSEPTWGTAIDSVTTDGTAEWTAIQALSVFGSVTGAIDRRFFQDATRGEPPTSGIGINSTVAQYAIRDTNLAGHYFEIEGGDLTSTFRNGDTFTVTGSPGNDGSYTVSSSSASGSRTRIIPSETIPDTRAGGFVTAPTAMANGFWTFGRLTFLTGANKGIAKEVKAFSLAGYSIVDLDQGAKTFMIDGDQTAYFAVDQRFAILGSTGNDGNYDVAAVSFNSGTSQTEIVVAQAITDATVDGSALSGPGQSELFERMPFEIEVGDEYFLTAGCDWAKATCKEKFDNIHNRRAEDEIPGTDVSLLTPDRQV